MVRERSAGLRYNGLKNQGATCYLNSVLQCLYMTEDFRREVENFRRDPLNPDEESADLMQELQKLFKSLKEGAGTTEGITRCLRISNVREQQDAVEYYQKTLKAIGPEVSKIFKGEMSNKTRCQNNHTFQEKCPFFLIPLSIEVEPSELFSVNKGLENFFKKVKFDEDNLVYCDHCDQKAEAETWTEIEEIPNILTLNLKRFHFDYYQMKLVKNHCPIVIPMQLLLKNYEYELYAVINHIGEQTGGHYNAVIRSFDDNEWYCFDDSFVQKVSEKPIHQIKSDLAFLLMYKKKVDVPHANESTKSTNDEPLQGSELQEPESLVEHQSEKSDTAQQEIKTKELASQDAVVTLDEVGGKDGDFNEEELLKCQAGKDPEALLTVDQVGSNEVKAVEEQLEKAHQGLNTLDEIVEKEDEDDVGSINPKTLAITVNEVGEEEEEKKEQLLEQKVEEEKPVTRRGGRAKRRSRRATVRKSTRGKKGKSSNQGAQVAKWLECLTAKRMVPGSSLGSTGIWGSLPVHPAVNGDLVETLGKLKVARKGNGHPTSLCRWPRTNALSNRHSPNVRIVYGTPLCFASNQVEELPENTPGEEPTSAENMPPSVTNPVDITIKPEEENLKAEVTSASPITEIARTEEEKPNIKQEDEVTVKESTAAGATAEKRAAIKESKRRHEDELNHETETNKPCPEPSTTDTLPPFSPNNPIEIL
ncbi:ubiquitin carboxyl-terminal hydrolase 48-like isoform X2 [Neoarius graeffei]|uniref:ubiquitin carboxyl-terminal hydrolase 48-like isoform X2 n=1 Tax=Neoarius graeffei TaxID=443677 RepID=UPI00298BF661|nr:ubiquitin carboxyl-terminal hydrolase 48-like isoform X2 [Neoarius graeffei]